MVTTALVVQPLSLRPATLRAITALTYFALTTGRGYQTLGEEYVELTPVAVADRLCSCLAGPLSRQTAATCMMCLVALLRANNGALTAKIAELAR